VKRRRVRFTPEAAAQAEAGDRWWRQHRPASPGLFANELRDAVELVARAPSTGQAFATTALEGVRRVPLHRTKFHVYFVVREMLVVIVAVWSARREEGPPLTSTGPNR